MEHSRYLELANLAIRLDLPFEVNDALAAELGYSWRFTSAVSEFPVIGRYRVHTEDLACEGIVAPRVELPHARMGLNAAGQWEIATPTATPGRWQLRARLREDLSEGDLWLGTREGGSDNRYPLEFPVRPLLVYNLLASHGVCVLHSSQVDLGRRSILFTGKSGAGKTTQGALWREAGYPTLNDETNLLFVNADGAAMAASTPWNGDYGRVTPSVQPLAGVFLLNQAAEDVAIRQDPLHAAMRVMSNTFSQRTHKEHFERVMDVFGRIAERAPVFELRNTATRRTVEVVLEALEQA